MGSGMRGSGSRTGATRTQRFVAFVLTFAMLFELMPAQGLRAVLPPTVADAVAPGEAKAADDGMPEDGTVSGDVTLTTDATRGVVQVSGNATIDLGGRTLTATSFSVVDNAQVTLKNGTLAAGGALSLGNGAQVVVDGCVVNVKSETSVPAILATSGEGTATVRIVNSLLSAPANTALASSGVTLAYGAQDGKGFYPVRNTANGTITYTVPETAPEVRATATPAAAIFNGEAQKLTSLEVTVGGVALEPTTDYTYEFTYVDAEGITRTISSEVGVTDARVYTVAITGAGLYQGLTASTTFEVRRRSIAAPRIVFNEGKDVFTYTGTAIDPTYGVGGDYVLYQANTVDDTEENLQTGWAYGIDFVNVYDNGDTHTNAGVHNLSITGAGSESFTSQAAPFTIVPLDIATSESIAVTGLDDQVLYGDKKATKPSVAITFTAADGSTIQLAEDSDYTITYAAGSAEGTAINDFSSLADGIVVYYAITGAATYDEATKTYSSNFTGTITGQFEIRTAEATIGDTPYATLAAALGAVPATDEATTVTLQKDVSVSENVASTSGQNAILDLNGHTLAIAEGATLAAGAKSTLTLAGTTGVVTGVGAVTAEKDGTLAVTGGTFDVMPAGDGTVAIGGVVTGDAGSKTLSSAPVFKAAVSAGACATDFYPAANTAESGKDAYPYTVAYCEGLKVAVKPNGASSYTPYSSLAMAVSDNKASGATLEVMADVTEEAWNQVWEPKDLTINGNGHTLTFKTIVSGRNGDFLLYKAENLVINDVTIVLPVATSTASAKGVYLSSGSLSNVTFKNGLYAVEPMGSASSTGPRITVQNCTFESTYASSCAVYTDSPAEGNGVVVSNCEFSGERAAFLRGNMQFLNNKVTFSGDNTALSVVGSDVVVTGNTMIGGKLSLYANVPTSGNISNNDFSKLTRVKADGSVKTAVLDGNYWGPAASTVVTLPAAVQVSTYKTSADDSSGTASFVAASSTDGGANYTYYATLEEAFGALDAQGGIVRLVADASLPTSEIAAIPDGVTVDVNGHKLTVPADAMLEVAEGRSIVDGGDASTGAVSVVGTLSVTGGSVLAKITQETGGAVSISGGTFGQNPDASWLGVGLTATKQDTNPETWVVALAEAGIAQSAGAYSAYGTLAEMVTQATAGSTIVLFKDVETATTISLSRSLTVDGKGHTIKANSSFDSTVKDVGLVDVSDGSTVTLRDVTVEPNGRAYSAINMAASTATATNALTLTGATVRTSRQSNRTIYVGSRNKLVVGEGSTVVHGIFGGGGTAEVEVATGGEVRGNVSYTSLTVSGGTVVPTGNATIGNQTKITVTGGTVGTLASDNDHLNLAVVVKGGTVNSNVTVKSSVSVEGGTIKGSITTPNTVTVSGGTINGSINQSNTSKLAISGGIFARGANDANTIAGVATKTELRTLLANDEAAYLLIAPDAVTVSTTRPASGTYQATLTGEGAADANATYAKTLYYGSADEAVADALSGRTVTLYASSAQDKTLTGLGSTLTVATKGDDVAYTGTVTTTDAYCDVATTENADDSTTYAVVIAEKYVARFDDTYYETLQAAVNAAISSSQSSGSEATVTLVRDVSAGDGVALYRAAREGYAPATSAKIAIDLGGHSYNVSGRLTGSKGTESQAFHLERDNTVTIKNGTLSSSKAAMLVQNYSNLTLQDVTLDGSKLAGSAPYTLSNNNGETHLKGATNVTAKTGGVAFDVCWAPNRGYAQGAKVYVDEDFTGTIKGKVELGIWGEVGTETPASRLEIRGSGTFDGTFAFSDDKAESLFTAETVNVYGGSFAKQVPLDFCGTDLMPGTKGEAGASTTAKEGYFTVKTGTAVAYIESDAGKVYYTTLPAAVAAAAENDTIVLVADVTLTDADTTNRPADANDPSNSNLWIAKSLTFDGGSDDNHTHTITVSNRILAQGGSEEIAVAFKNLKVVSTGSVGQCIITRAGVSSISLENVSLVANGDARYLQPLTIGSDAKHVTVSVKDSDLRTDDGGTKGYAIILWSPVDLTVTNTSLTAWGDVYFKPDSEKSTATVDKCVITSKNIHTTDTNWFSAFPIEADDVHVTVTNSKINVTTTGNQVQSVVHYHYTGSDDDATSKSTLTLGTGNDVTLTGDHAFIAFNVNAPSYNLGTATAIGGKFNVQVDLDLCDANHRPSTYTTGISTVDGAKDGWTVVEGRAVAIIDRRTDTPAEGQHSELAYYPTLQEALDDAADGETVSVIDWTEDEDDPYVLKENVTLRPTMDGATSKADKAVTLDLDGTKLLGIITVGDVALEHTAKLTVQSGIVDGGTGSAFDVTSKGELTIAEDTSTTSNPHNLTTSVIGSSTATAPAIKAAGTVRVTGGTVSGGSANVQLCGGSLAVAANDAQSSVTTPSFVGPVNIDVASEGGTATVDGGTFVASVANIRFADGLEAVSTVTINKGRFVSAKGTQAANVVSSGSDATKAVVKVTAKNDDVLFGTRCNEVEGATMQLEEGYAFEAAPSTSAHAGLYYPQESIAAYVVVLDPQTYTGTGIDAGSDYKVYKRSDTERATPVEGITITPVEGASLAPASGHAKLIDGKPGDAGTYAVEVSGARGDAALSGTTTCTFEVLPVTIANDDVALGEIPAFTGSAVEPTVTVRASVGGTERELVPTSEYDVVYASTAAYTAGTATVTGVGNFAGTVVRTYDVPATNIATSDRVSVYLSASAPSVEGIDATGLASKESVEAALATANATEVWHAGATAHRYVAVYDGTPVAPVLTLVVDVDDDTMRVYTYDPSDDADEAARKLFKTYFVARPAVMTYAPSEVPYVLVATGRGFEGEPDVTFDIVRASITASDVAPIADVTYDGTAQEPVPTITVDGQELQAGVDFEVSYVDNVNAGTATAVIRGLGGYATADGGLSVSFEIKKALVTGYALNGVDSAQDWTRPFVASDDAGVDALVLTSDSLAGEDKTLALGEDYTVKVSEVRGDVGNAGAHKLTVTVSDNFIARYQTMLLGIQLPWPTWEKTLTISPIDLSDPSLQTDDDPRLVVSVPDMTYTGTVITSFDPSVVYDGKPLTRGVLNPLGQPMSGVDYRIDYAKTKAANEIKDVNTGDGYAVVLEGVGNYAGVIPNAKVRVLPVELTAEDTTLVLRDDVVYTGTEITDAVTAVKLGGVTLSDADYELSYADNLNAGTATVTVKGKQPNTTGEFSQTFEIAKAQIPAKALREITYYGTSAKHYTGYAQEGVKLDKLADYGIERVADATAVTGGTHSFTAFADANHSFVVDGVASDFATGTFNINVATLRYQLYTVDTTFDEEGKATTPDYAYTGGAIEPAIALVTNYGDVLPQSVVGDVLDVSYSDNVEPGRVIVHVTSNDKQSVRGEGYAYYLIAAVEGLDFDFVASGDTYTGSAIEGTVSNVHIGSVVLGEDEYAVSYANNVDAGTATVTVTSTSDRVTGSVSKNYTIKPTSLADAGVTVSGPAKVTFAGKDVRPDFSGQVVVQTADGARTLVEGVDYDIYNTYVKDAARGTYVGVSRQVGYVVGDYKTYVIGKGNYAQTTGLVVDVTALPGFEFKIVPATIDGATLTDRFAAKAVYNGSKVEPSKGMLFSFGSYSYYVSSDLTVTAGDLTVSGFDFEVVTTDGYSNVDAGDASVTVRSISDNFVGEVEVPYVIAPAQLTDAAWKEGVANKVYTGEVAAVTSADFTAKAGPIVLADSDFEVSTTSVDAGDATATITAKAGSNFTGSVEGVTFTIAQQQASVAFANVAEGDETGTPTDDVYNGGVVAPAVVVRDASGAALDASEYVVTYADLAADETDAKKIGDKFDAGKTVEVVVTLKSGSNYAFANDASSAQLSFAVTPAAAAIAPVDAVFEVGAVIEPAQLQALVNGTVGEQALDYALKLDLTKLNGYVEATTIGEGDEAVTIYTAKAVTVDEDGAPVAIADVITASYQDANSGATGVNANYAITSDTASLTIVSSPKDELAAKLIAALNALDGAQPSVTNDSYQALVSAIAKGEKVNDDQNASGTDVAVALEALNAALDGLTPCVNVAYIDTAVTDEEDNVTSSSRVYYQKLHDAVQAAKTVKGATVTIFDHNGDGVVTDGGAALMAGDDAEITIDFAGLTYKVTGDAKGSRGYETQGLHLEKGNTVTLRNGTLKADNPDEVRMLVQNYANLTYVDMTLDGSNLPEGAYASSNNNGTVSITGNTSIIAPENGYAFDVYSWPTGGHPEGAQVTVDTTGTIKGTIQFGADSSSVTCGLLTIKNGVFTAKEGTLFDANSKIAAKQIQVVGGFFSEQVPEKWVGDGLAHTGVLANGMYSVAHAISVDFADVKDSYVYTGSPIEPVAKVTNDKDKTLVANVDYVVTYAHNVDASPLGVKAATITVTGIGAYAGTAAKVFGIDKAVVDKPTLVNELVTYNGSEQVGVLAPDAGVAYTLSEGSVTQATDAGEYEVTATLANDNYTWKVDEGADADAKPCTLKWTIAKKQATITAEDKSSKIGAGLADLTVAASGLLDGESELDKLVTLSVTTMADKNTAGSYPIAVAITEQANANYDFTLADGTYTVEAADTSALEVLKGLAEVAQQAKDSYTSASYRASGLEDALAKATEALADDKLPTTTQDEVDDISAKLADALDALVPKATDLDKAKELVAEVEKLLADPETADKYTPSTLAQLKSALAAAQDAVADDGDATQGEVDSTSAALAAALKALAPRANTAALDEAIAAAQADAGATAVSEDGADVPAGKVYVTSATAAALNEAIAEAARVAGNADATQGEVDAAKQTLADAQKAFDGAKNAGKLAADKQALNSVIASAVADRDATPTSRNGSDIATDRLYATPSAVNALNDAIATAQALANSGTATQAAVNEATQALRRALATFDGSKTHGTLTPQLTVQGHIQTTGWQNAAVVSGNKSKPTLIGTVGLSKRLEAIRFAFNGAAGYSGGVVVNAHVQTYGWQGTYTSVSGSTTAITAGTVGESKRVEALTIALTGEVARHYDVYYRAHVQSYGWRPWVKNGAVAGTTGESKRLEAIEIYFAEKQ